MTRIPQPLEYFAEKAENGDPVNNPKYYTIHRNGVYFADVHVLKTDHDHLSALADAALFAAAPKMLDALEKAAEFIHDQYACASAQALGGELLSKEARPIWAILSEAIAEARAGESDTQ